MDRPRDYFLRRAREADQLAASSPTPEGTAMHEWIAASYRARAEDEPDGADEDADESSSILIKWPIS